MPHIISDFKRCWEIVQEKVACLADNDARIALDPCDSYLIQVCTYIHLKCNWIPVWEHGKEKGTFI